MKKQNALFLSLAMAIVFVLSSISILAAKEGEIKAYRNIGFGITRGELVKRVDEDEKIKSSGHSFGWEDRDNWTEFDWAYEYASREIWVYIGDTKYDIVANFYGNEKDPNGGMGDEGFVPGQLIRLWFMSPLETYLNIDLVLDRRDYLAQVISRKYGDPGETQKVEPVNLESYETKFSHVWYGKQTGTDKRIKIGIECSSSGNYYLAVMAIEQPELVEKRQKAEKKQDEREAEEESKDF